MPLGISRLVLSTSAIRRVFGDVITDLEFITTQDGRTLQDQDLRFIAVEQSDKITDTLASLGLDAITTQDGKFFALNQNLNQVLLLEQDFDTAGDTFISQDGRALQTQNNRSSHLSHNLGFVCSIFSDQTSVALPLLFLIFSRVE